MTTPPNPYAVSPANIRWEDNAVPVASHYGDVYFSRDDGLAESRFVFLQHNRLEARWQQLNPQQSGTFTIIETGFGTGLNFLLAWQLWLQCAPPSWRLHYVSVEKHPLRIHDLRRAHSTWPSLHELAVILQHNYPPLIPGQHRRLLKSAQVCLELLIGDLKDCLPALVDAPCVDAGPNKAIAADAWFLDGFAPASNPDMWSDTLFACIGELSRPGTTVATFTAAGLVKRGLKAQGFAIEKVKGFGRKREMLCGEKSTHHVDDTSSVAKVKVPWHQPQPKGTIRHVAIIGAGLAGASTAQALAQRGYEVTVFERGADVATAASGNPQGILYTKLSPQPGTLNQFTLASFLYAQHYYKGLIDNGEIAGNLCGVLQVAANDKELAHFQRLKALLGEQNWLTFLDAEAASKQAGFQLQQPAVFYPESGWLVPPSVCRFWLQHANITLCLHTEVCALVRSQEQWQLLDQNEKVLLAVDAVVIANSCEARRLAATADLPLKAIRGQLSYIEERALTHQPNTVICHEGYLAPAVGGKMILGASFDLHSEDTQIREEDHSWNFQQLRDLAPDLLRDNTTAIGGRAALRCASPDYHPIVGALPDPQGFQGDYAALRHDARRAIPITGKYYPNLYCNLAHGSRGLSSTPLCAELLASYINNEIRPLPRELCESVSPARFLIRALKKNRR